MRQRLLLVGGGHAHAGVLRAQAREQLLDADITIVSPAALAPYSGMLPGWMAGHYTWQQICLNFEALAAKAGATFVAGEAAALDLASKTLHLQDGRALAFDVISLNIGSTHRPPITGDGNAVLALRPLGSLQTRVQEFLQQAAHTTGPLTVRIIGAGGAGFEMALAMHHSLKRAYADREIDVRIITDGTTPLPTHSAPVQRLAATVLRERGVPLITEMAVEHIDGHTLHLRSVNRQASTPSARAELVQAQWTPTANQTVSRDIQDQSAQTQPASNGLRQAQPERHTEALATESTETVHKIIWAAGAQPHLWPQQSGLALDAHGFIAIDATLASTSHPFVFATGDCAGFTPPLPKAGVYAVRQGPVLAANLSRVLQGTPLQVYTPQPRALGLFATGPKHAIASYGPLAFAGEWVWRWKDRIDRQFLKRHSV